MTGSRPHRRRLSVPVACALCAAASGCQPAAGERVAGGVGAAGSWSDLSARIFVPRCASAACHGGEPPAFAPRLDGDASWAAVVGVPSGEAPGRPFVVPGDPARSYLVSKLRGTAAEDGGGGARMPPDGAPVDDADLALIEGWISSGALDD